MPKIDADLNHLYQDLQTLFSTDTGKALFVQLGSTVIDEGKPSTLGGLGNGLTVSDLKQPIKPLCQLRLIS